MALRNPIRDPLSHPGSSPSRPRTTISPLSQDSDTNERE